jgi:ParB-like chromosome segregation protein Spo0J
LGWQSIHAICEDMNDAEAAARVVTENEMRTDTNILEKAAGYKRLTQAPCSFSLDEIAKRYGYSSHASVKRIIDLLEQPAAIRDLVSQDTIGEGHVRFLNRIKDLTARTRTAKRAAMEGWTVKMTEKRVAKLLAKAHKGPLNSPGKTAPSQQYQYNGFRCARVGDEVVIRGRNFKRTKDSVRQFVADFQSALECFLRDIDAASAEQSTAVTSRLQEAAGASLTNAAAPADVASPTLAADLLKQAADVEAAGQPLKELLSFFNKPKSSG